MSRKFTISEGLESGIAMVRLGWRRAGLVLALMAVAATMYNGFQNQAGMALAAGASFAVYIVLGLAASGALFRLAALPSEHLRAEEVGAGGLQWRSTEWTLLRLSAFYVGIFMALALVLVAIAALLLRSSGVDISLLQKLADPVQGEAVLMANPALARSIGLVLIVGLVVYCLLIWAAIRLSLVTVDTAVSGKVRPFHAWPLTKGHFWRIFGGLLVIALPSILLGMVVGALDARSVTSGNAGLSAQGIWAMAGATGLLTAFVITPMQIGFTAEAYRKLSAASADR